MLSDLNGLATLAFRSVVQRPKGIYNLTTRANISKNSPP